MLLFVLALIPGNNAWARTLLRLYGFQQSLSASYEVDNVYQDTGASKTGNTTQLFAERYKLKLGYNVVSAQLWRGEAGFGVKANQQFSGKQQGGGTSDLGLNYDLNGTMFRLKPVTFSFYLGSNELRVNPAFGSSYDVTSDYRGAALSVKNATLPVTLSQSHIQTESSGQLRDRRSVQSTFGVHAGNNSFAGLVTSSASLITSHGFSETLSGPSEQQNHSSVSGNVGNTVLLTRDAELSRMLSSNYTWSGEDGSSKGKNWTLQESLNWDFGKSLKMRVLGDANHSELESKEKDLQTVRANLSHELLETLSTSLFGDFSRMRVDGGSHKGMGQGVNLHYHRILPRDSTLSIGYGISRSLSRSRNASGTVFHRDERLNANLSEAENYLSREDIEPATVVVWNAGRTITYLPSTDYTVIQDGRRTRLRVETGGAITQGEPLSIDYTVQVNPELEFKSFSQSAQASLSLWQAYVMSLSWSHSEQEKLSGADDVAPIGANTSYAARVERIGENYRLGAGYSKAEAPTLTVQKVEGSWKYNREFEVSAFSVSLSDVLSMYQPTATSSVVMQGGDSNSFSAGAQYRRNLSDRIRLMANGGYQTSSGRGLSQHLISSWLRGAYTKAGMETELNVRTDWRFYREQYQRNFTARLDFKRFF